MVWIMFERVENFLLSGQVLGIAPMPLTEELGVAVRDEYPPRSRPMGRRGRAAKKGAMRMSGWVASRDQGRRKFRGLPGRSSA